MKNKTEIKSAHHAMRESLALPSCWSRETLLTQRILIYVAGLLEQMLKQCPGRRKKHKPSRWHKHVAKYLRSGKTIKEAAADWTRQG